MIYTIIQVGDFAILVGCSIDKKYYSAGNFVSKNIVFYLCLVRGMLTQLAAATAMKGTQRARRGGADCKKEMILILLKHIIIEGASH